MNEVTTQDFEDMLVDIYRYGASPDILFVDEAGVDRLWHLGCITRREYVWLKLKFFLGRLKRNVTSGVRSALQTIGTGLTV